LVTTGYVGSGFLGGLIAVLAMVGYVVYLMRKGSSKQMMSVAQEVA
jgi:ferrous iron transport protein B